MNVNDELRSPQSDAIQLAVATIIAASMVTASVAIHPLAALVVATVAGLAWLTHAALITRGMNQRVASMYDAVFDPRNVARGQVGSCGLLVTPHLRSVCDPPPPVHLVQALAAKRTIDAMYQMLECKQ